MSKLTTEQIKVLIKKFKAARKKCVQAQAGRNIGFVTSTKEDVREWSEASEEYADAAIELALAVTYHFPTIK